MSESSQDLETGKSNPGSEDMNAEAVRNNRLSFLLADLQHFGQSLLQNEQMGEGRFRFFLTLITASIAGLVALHTANNEHVKAALPVIVNVALIVLFLFGVLTYLRMLQRDRVSEGYKQDLKYIRHLLRDQVGLTNYEVPFQPHIRSAEDDTSGAEDDTNSAKKRWISFKIWWERRLRAGYTQTVGAVSTLLFSMLVLYDLHLMWKHSWLIKLIKDMPVLGILVVLIVFVALCLAASDLAVRNKQKAKEHAETARDGAEEPAKPDKEG